MEDFDFRVIVLILFLVVSALQWVGKRFKGNAQNPDSEEPQSSSSLADIYEQYREQIRDEQTTLQTERVQEVAKATPPPIPQPSTPKAQPLAAPMQQSFSSSKPQLTKAQREAAERFENLTKSGKQAQTTSDANATIRALLSSPSSAKQAVILTEILSKPKSMQRDSYGY